MQSVEDVVRETVQHFISQEMLFTALDVSNKVKETMPFARHREVRDLIREMYLTEIETADYARTPISVVLADGSVADALLYHPLADIWNLDAKYDDQKRSQTSARPAPTVPQQPTNTAIAVASTSSQVATPVNVVAKAKSLWDQMFKNQPSLFPKQQ